VIVLAVVLLIFGAKRLPEMGRSLGGGFRQFKKGITGEDEASETLPRQAASSSEESEPSTTRSA
jgi:sec-independent protein translocase protein TatA